MAEIHEEQGTERGLLLQRAADGSHVVAHRLELVRVIISLLFGVAAVVSAAWPSIAPALAIAGAAWAVLSFAVVGLWSQRESEAAAVAQETFDTWLFGLPWNKVAAGPPPAAEELRRRARRSTLAQERMLTWYPNVSGLTAVYGTLVCQRENLTWDWRLRRRYAFILNAAAVVWISVGVVVGLSGDLSVRELVLRWFVPSSSALLLATQQARGHRGIAEGKERLATLVRGELDGASSGPLSTEDEARLWELSRSVQDGLLVLRKRSERVPRWLYERFRDSDEADMRETAAELRARLMQ